MAPLDDRDDAPTWRDPRLAHWAPTRARIATLVAGTDAVREAAATLIPKMPRETRASWRLRVRMTDVTPFCATAIRTGVGLLLHQPPTLAADADPVLRALWDDLDGLGSSAHVWLQSVAELVLRDGWCLAVVASPVRAEAPPTLADEQRQQLRPYVVMYEAEQVRSIRLARRGGRLLLDQVVLTEVVDVPRGRYATARETQHRVLRYGTPGAHEYEVWAEDAEGRFHLREAGTIATEALPVVEISSDPRAGVGRAAPPLRDVADLNLAHVNVLSDRRWSMKMACYPLPVRKGYQAPSGGDETTAGPTEIMDLPSDGDFRWVSPEATAMQPTRDELVDLERRIAAITLSFLAGESPVAAATATARQIDQQGQDAALASVAVQLQDATNEILWHLAELAGVAPRSPLVTLHTTLRGRRRDPAFLRLLVELWRDGGLPLDALLHALQTGDLPDALDAVVLDALAASDAAEAARAADAAAQAREMRLGDA
jgi:hypothetical protein